MQVSRVSSGRFVAGSVETSRGDQVRVGFAWGVGAANWSAGARVEGDQNKWVVWTRVAKLCRGLKLPQHQQHLRLRLQLQHQQPQPRLPSLTPSRLVACQTQEWR